MQLTLGEIATLVDGRLQGDGARVVSRVTGVDSAGPDDLTFVAAESYLDAFLGSAAGAAIVYEGAETPGRDVVHHPNPFAAVALVLAALFPEEEAPPGISELAVVHATAQIGEGVSVGPFSVVEAGVVLGDRVRIGPNCYVGPHSRIGADTRFHPGVCVYSRTIMGERCLLHTGAVIGADGFGYTSTSRRHIKKPQAGGVVMGDDVEIGANTTVDRGTLEPTVLRNQVKLDNLVQVGHNCDIGERTLLCAHVGIAGSTKLGSDCVMAGQSGVADHVTIGDRVMGGAKTAILTNVPSDRQVGGIPQFDFLSWRRASIAFRKLPQMRQELRQLRQRLDALEGGKEPR